MQPPLLNAGSIPYVQFLIPFAEKDLPRGIEPWTSRFEDRLYPNWAKVLVHMYWMIMLCSHTDWSANSQNPQNYINYGVLHLSRDGPKPKPKTCVLARTQNNKIVYAHTFITLIGTYVTLYTGRVLVFRCAVSCLSPAFALLLGGLQVAYGQGLNQTAAAWILRT